jgi:hypothetical protein
MARVWQQSLAKIGFTLDAGLIGAAEKFDRRSRSVSVADTYPR